MSTAAGFGDEGAERNLQARSNERVAQLQTGAAVDPLLDPPENLPPEVTRRLRLLDTQVGLGWLATAVGGLFLLAFAGFLATGANGPSDPQLGASTLRQPPAGFGEVRFTVNAPDAPPSEYCGILADSGPARQKGMMGRTDLGGYDAMIFRFDADQTGTFWNRNVPIALSIAWFDGGGKFVSTSDMPPCDDSDECPLYKASAPYRYALEVPQGGLARFALAPGTVLTAGGPCPEDAPED